MSLIEFRAARLLASQPRLLFSWAQDGTREDLQRQFNNDSLTTKHKQIGALHELFIAELRYNLKLLHPSDDKAARYLKVVEEIFARGLQQQILTLIKGLVIQIGSEQNSSRQGMTRDAIAWLKIQNGLKASALPLNSNERSLLGALYVLAIGAVRYVQAGIEEVRNQYDVLEPLPLTDKDYNAALQQPLGARRDDTQNQEFTLDTWGGLLENGFTVIMLKNVLSRVIPPLLDEQGKPTVDSKPRMWAAVVAALRDAEKISRTDNAAFHRNVVREFGDVASESQLRVGYNDNNLIMRALHNSVKGLVSDI
ncbi:hypothetical protein [Hymenobacter norwichensis]|uniref:hypothetical protein n=1 Tax=Hymenobacter norwichensis TaxID=223903 RepID=UPI0003B316D2|nr:hypothetical protein [Hymenobacter norwichensis]